MKVVQIISGGYGFRAKAGAPTKLILAGEVVCVDDAEAERLVKLGVPLKRNWMRKLRPLWSRLTPTATMWKRRKKHPKPRKSPAEKAARLQQSKQVLP